MTVTQSDSVDQLATALSAAQGELEFAVKDSKNPHFKNTYASLASVIDAVRPIFCKHGLSFSQDPVSEGDLIGVVTTVFHKSGQWKRGVLLCKPAKAGPQEAGSVITYFRRYALAAVAGIAQDDDDAETGSGRPSQQQPKVEAQAPATNAGAQMLAEMRTFGIKTAPQAVELYRFVLGKDKPENDADRRAVIEALLAPTDDMREAIAKVDA